MQVFTKGTNMQHAPIDTFNGFFLGLSIPSLFFLLVFCSMLLRRHLVKIRRQKAIAAAFEIRECLTKINARTDGKYSTCELRSRLEQAGNEFIRLKEEAKKITSARQLAEIQLIATKEVVKLQAMASMEFSPISITVERLAIEHREAKLKEELAVRRSLLVAKQERELRELDVELRDINEHIAKIRKELEQFELAANP